MNRILAIWILAALALPALAQKSGDAQVFRAADTGQQLAQLTSIANAKGSGGATLGDYGSHALKLSLRSTDGGAEIHGHFDDVMMVMHGSATLITGGAVIDPHTGNDGETKGSGIRAGVRQTVAEGDIIHIPAGTPHQLLIPKDTVFTAFVVKVRE